MRECNTQYLLNSLGLVGNIYIGKLYASLVYKMFFTYSLRSYHLFWSPIKTYNHLLVNFGFIFKFHLYIFLRIAADLTKGTRGSVSTRGA